jgi:hypothetical protein
MVHCRSDFPTEIDMYIGGGSIGVSSLTRE